METVVVTKNLKNQSVIMGKTVAKLEKLIMQIDSIADQINVGDDTYKMKKIIKSNAINLEQTKDKLKRMSITLDQISKLYESTENDICENVQNREVLLSRKNYKNPSSILIIPTFFEKIKELSECIRESIDDLLEYFIKLKKALDDYNKSGEGDLYEWILKYEPQLVSDEAILGFLHILSVPGLSEEQIKTHRDWNDETWKLYVESHGEPKYIEQQNSLKKYIYGNHNADYNTCEVIATYNALKALGDKDNKTFPELIQIFETSGIVLKGEWGTSPISVNKYFENHGYKTDMIYGDKINEKSLSKMSKDHDTYILTAYNNKTNLGEQVHTVSITVENGKYVIHNNGDDKRYNSLEEAIKGFNNGKGEPISVIGISK